MQIIQSAHAQYKAASHSAMAEALRSCAQTAGLLAGAAALGAGALWYVARDGRANPAIATGGVLGTVAALVAGVVRSIDAKQDLDLWLHLNSGANRARFTTGLFEAQVGAVTRLSTVWADNAIAANAWSAPVREAEVQREPVQVHHVPAPVLPVAPVDIALSLATVMKSSLIVAQPGAGKGRLVAYATRALKQLHPDITIWAIPVKDDTGELADWNACDELCLSVLPAFAMAEQIEQFQKDVEQFIEGFKAVPGRKLLILDEALGVKELMPRWFKGIMAGFNHLCSTGRSKGIYGWMMSQTPNADDFGISGGARNVYRRILLLCSDDLGLISNKTSFFSGAPTPEQLASTGRVFFDSLGETWGVVPRYPDINEPARERVSTGGESRHEKLERMWAADPAIPSHEQFYHSAPKAANSSPFSASLTWQWMEWLRKQAGGVTVRECQRSAPSALRFAEDGKVTSAESLRELFSYLQSIGEGSATPDKYVPNPQNP